MHTYTTVALIISLAASLCAEESIIGSWANEFKGIEFTRKGKMEIEIGESTLRGEYSIRNGTLVYTFEPLNGMKASGETPFTIKGDTLNIGGDTTLKRDELRPERKKIKSYVKDLLSAVVMYQSGAYEGDSNHRGYFPRSHLVLDGTSAVPGDAGQRLSIIPEGYYDQIKENGYVVKLVNPEMAGSADNDGIIICLIGNKATFMSTIIDGSQKNTETKDDISKKSYAELLAYFNK